jgi:hypothetical protein
MVFFVLVLDLDLEHRFFHPQWQQSINLMLEKVSGSRLVHKLQIIHLFEADFNFVLKLIWGKHLMHHAEDQGYFGNDQHRSQSGCQASDAALKKKTLAYKYARVT